MLGIVSDHCTQLVLSMLGAGNGHLLGKLCFEVLVGTLKGLLAPKSKTLVLPLLFQELLHMCLQNVNLKNNEYKKKFLFP